jgi:hypothetical protein
MGGEGSAAPDPAPEAAHLLLCRLVVVLVLTQRGGAGAPLDAALAAAAESALALSPCRLECEDGAIVVVATGKATRATGAAAARLAELLDDRGLCAIELDAGVAAEDLREVAVTLAGHQAASGAGLVRAWAGAGKRPIRLHAAVHRADRGRETYLNAVYVAEQFLDGIRRGARLDVRLAKRVVSSVADLLVRQRRTLPLLVRLLRAPDRLCRAAHACVFAALAGLRLGLRPPLAAELGAAALLVNVGRMPAAGEQNAVPAGDEFRRLVAAGDTSPALLRALLACVPADEGSTDDPASACSAVIRLADALAGTALVNAAPLPHAAAEVRASAAADPLALEIADALGEVAELAGAAAAR